MFAPILKVCPSFQPVWDEFLAEWQDDPNGLPHYLALSDLARHLIAMLERKETEKIQEVFAIVESWHLDGDPYVKEAASVGLLEDLQNTNLYEGKMTPDGFVQFLLPESRYWWDKINEYWEEGKLIQDDRPRY